MRKCPQGLSGIECIITSTGVVDRPDVLLRVGAGAELHSVSATQ